MGEPIKGPETPAPAPTAPPAAPPQDTEIKEVISEAQHRLAKELDPTQFQKIVVDREKLVQEAKRSLSTRPELLALRTTIDEESKEAENTDVTDGKKAELAALRSDIDAMIAERTNAVTDVDKPDPKVARPLLERIKDWGIMGSLAEAYVSIMKLFRGSDKQTLLAIEENAAKFFGTSMRRNKLNTLLKGKGIEVVKGTSDVEANGQISDMYYTELALRQTPKKGPDGKDIPLRAEQIKAIADSFTLDVFLNKLVADYVKQFPVPAGQKRVTTLKGIAKSEEPTVMAS